MKKIQTGVFLETARLKVLVPKINDLDEQFLLQSDPRVMKFIGSGVRTREEVKVSLEKAVVHYEKFGFSLGSVFEKATKKFVGRAGLINLGFDEKANEIEVAYALLPEYWGQGYATELAFGLLQWGFENLSVPKLVAVTNKENLQSRRVLEKVGMILVKEVTYNGIPAVYYEGERQKFLSLSKDMH
jgi:RimJ/RimL family protein N-acetyltransferase